MVINFEEYTGTGGIKYERRFLFFFLYISYNPFHRDIILPKLENNKKRKKEKYYDCEKETY